MFFWLMSFSLDERDDCSSIMVIGRYGGGLNDIELLLFVLLESSSRIPEDGSVEVCDNDVKALAWP
jgi:hypothetical protein